MAELEDKVLKEFKTKLIEKEEISEKLAAAIVLELQKDAPNPERLAGTIQLKKDYLNND
jgi:hypothetical protein